LGCQFFFCPVCFSTDVLPGLPEDNVGGFAEFTELRNQLFSQDRTSCEREFSILQYSSMISETAVVGLFTSL
jgi:hypothetical protein